VRTAEFQVTVGATRVALPDVETWSISPISDGTGVVQLTYPAAGRSFATLRAFVDGDKDALLIVRIDGNESPNFTTILSEAVGDTADPAAIWTFSGRFQAVYLDQAVIYPDPAAVAITLAGGLDDASRSFGAMNGGQILALLMTEAQARGAASLVTFASFNSAHDSNGAAWTTVTTTSCSPGITILSLLNTLETAGLFDWQMVGADLRLYNPGMLGRDLTLSNPPIILHGPRDLTQAQRTFSSKAAVTAVLAAGGAGLYTSASDATALARRGRRVEGYVSSANITDPGTLTAFTATSLAAMTDATLQVTHGLAMQGGPLPLTDFDVADWIWSDTGNGLERLQVAQWSASMDSAGILSGTVTLNDLVASRAVLLQRQINALGDGTSVVGTSTPPPVTVDEIAPNPPTGLTASSAAFIASTGVTQAQITAGWVAPTHNVDSSVLTDLAGYNVIWAYASGQGLSTAVNLVPGLVPAGTTTLSWSPLLPGVHVNVQVQAIDTSGNVSTFTSAFNVVTATDATAPPQPSTPVVAPYLGQLKITWDGLGSAGQAMPSDFNLTEVHVSLTSGFTPSAATLTDQLTGAATSIASGLVYGNTYFVRLVATDKAGNRSAASTQATGVPVQAANGDVSDLNVGKLTAGILSAVVTVSGRFATALTGARTEINSGGFFQYDSTGLIKLVEISNSNISIQGVFKTVGPDGSFIELVTTPGFARLEMQGGGGVTHITTTAQMFMAVSGAGTSTERSNMIIASGKESSNDDAAVQLFSEDASGVTQAQAIIEFGGHVTAQFSRVGTVLTTAAGWSGIPDISQFDTTVDTNANNGTQPCTAQWTIPANDAQVHTTYEVATEFNGTLEPTGVFAFKPSLNNISLTTAGGDGVTAGTYAVATGINGRVKVKVQILTTGASGTATITLEGNLGPNGNRTPANTVVLSSIILSQAIDTTVANTIAINSEWLSVVTGQTVSTRGSTYTRKGA
jgi:hypothetical protein